MAEKIHSKLNKTITLSPKEKEKYTKRLKTLTHTVTAEEVRNVTIYQDMRKAIRFLPDCFVDLLFIDPPYNLTKSFNGHTFKQTSTAGYAEWLESWFSQLTRLLKPTASIYVCGDCQSAASIQLTLEKYFTIRNRITWEREKGRGAKSNWKNSSEDIWFATVSAHYTFNVEDVKLKRRVMAPYTDESGSPKDWVSTPDGDFRLTHPSNIWTDLTVPFWSMAENTDHPTQKPEKLLAKVILASSNPEDFVFDPFLGSGTTSVAAKKLRRYYCGIEIDETYCCLAEKRLEIADLETSIQGYEDGVFWERNTGLMKAKKKKQTFVQSNLFALTTITAQERK